MKGFLCQAHSGKDVSYTTVKHGSIMVPKTSISIIASIQPSPLVELLSARDDQSFYDRFIMIAASEDETITDVVDQFFDISDEVRESNFLF